MGFKWHNTWAALLLVLALSATWLTTLLARSDSLNPVDVLSLMMEDLQGLGPIAFILDFIVLGLIIVWWRRRKPKKKQPKWESAFPAE